MAEGRRLTVSLSVLVGLVLADSAIVTLALPDILRELHATVTGVAWVLISFNLVLALAAVPATRLHGPRACTAGALVFAVASATCAVAPSLAVLLVARCAQAFGGVVVVVSCLALLVAATGSAQRGTRRWALSGVVGAATGPVAGGLLTSAISWQAIFVVQVPLVLLALPALRSAPSAPPARDDDRPDLRANASLALISAALTAALFLLVLMLVDGWRRSPAVAALTVTVIPLAAALAPPLARRVGAGAAAEVRAGCLLLAGGLAALSIPPAAHLAWTLAPQVLVGLGLGLTIDSLTADALRDRLALSRHGGWTIAARHAGVVLGLVVLTPVFTADLRAAQTPAKEAIAALVLDAHLEPATKVALAQQLTRRLQADEGSVPDLHPAFAAVHVPSSDRGATRALERALDDQVTRAATRAFRTAFLIAAACAVLALPLQRSRR